MADITGTTNNDYISTTDGNDTVNALSGNDIINGSAGNDFIDGGQGEYNQVDYDGWLSDYSFKLNDDGSVAVAKPNGGVDTLCNIGGLWFCREDRWVSIEDLPYDDGQNNAPSATNDWADVTTGQASTIDVLSNDSDLDGGDLQVTAINGVAVQPGWNTWVENVGLITVNADGTLTLESPFPGDFCFEYTISDGNGGTSTAVVEGKSNPQAPANSDPIAANDWVNGTVGTVSTFSPLENDTDADGDALTVTAINGTPMQPGWSTWVDNVGTVTVNADGTLSLDSQFPGDFCFEYTISAGNGGTSTAMIEGTNTPTAPTNSDPIAKNDWVDGTTGTVSTFSPLENDSDADGDALSITAINGTPMQPGWSTWIEGVGTVTVNADGTLSLESPYEGYFCFEYTISDGNGGTSTALVEGTNTVAPGNTNQGPISTDDHITGEAGEVLTVSPLSNDSDADCDTLTITEIHGTTMQPGWMTWVEGVGLVTLNADNTLSIEPIPGLTFVNFNYTISDGNGGTSTSTICGSIENGTVNSVSATADSATTNAGTPVTIDVLENDTDPDGDAFSVTQFYDGANGTVTQAADGSLIYTPNDGFSGEDTFTYTITDDMGNTDSTTVTVNVAPKPLPAQNVVNATDDSTSTDNATPIEINVLGNDSDPEGDSFSITGFSAGSNGTVVQGANGYLIYTPNAGFSGEDTFTYTITDSKGATDTATVTVVVADPGTPNTTDAVNDTAWTNEDEAVTIDVTNNDTDPEGDNFSVTNFANGANGIVSQSADGQLVYTPNAGFSGQDTFTYTITDANGATDTATVTVDVAAVTPPPQNTTDAVDDTANAANATAVVIDVLANDNDSEGDTFTITGFANGANGTVSQNAAGHLVYTPNAGFSGQDTFTYTITDAKGATDTATVTVVVADPVTPNSTDAVDDAANAENATPVVIDVLANDKDTEGDAFSITGFENGANGTVSQNAAGHLVYTPNAGFSGQDTFTYTITDAKGATDTATVTIVVADPETPNTTDAVDDAAWTTAGEAVTIDVTNNDKDAEGDAFSVTGFGNGANGTVSQTADGQLVYTPNAGFSGTDTFTYTITDAKGAVDTATVTVDVQELNSVDAVDDSANTNANQAVIIDTLSNDSDAQGDAFSITGFNNGANGTVTQHANGKLIYTPNPDFVGKDSFTYTITDANGAVDTATVDVDIQPAVGTASIGDTVFLDNNGSGLNDDGDTIKSGVTIELLDGNGNVISAQVTDANGNFFFNGLAEGQYQLHIILPEGFALTEQDARGGNKHGTDSDFDVNSGTTGVFNLADGQVIHSADAGLLAVSSPDGDDPAQAIEDQASAFNVLAGDQGLTLVGVSHETPELQAEFEARGGHLSFDAAGNVVYRGMTDYYGNDVLTYTVENANGERSTHQIDVDVKEVSDGPQVDVTEDFQRGVSGYHNDKSYQTHITHHSSSERYVPVNFFEPFINDDKDGLQQFSDYNVGVADDTDKIAFIEIFDAEDNGTIWRKSGEVVDPVDGVVRIPWHSIILGGLTVDLPGPWTEHTFNFRAIDTGGNVSGQKGTNVSNSDFITAWTPVALDLNGDGKIGVTGETSSHEKDADAEIGETVQFDIDADGDLDTIEWFDGSGDGILVDMSKIGADGSIDGSALFGDEGGQYANGYDKLKAFDTNGDGQVSGEELNTIGVWIDDGDAILEEGELITAAEQGIASVSTEMEIVLDEDGNELMQSTATTSDGQVILTEDVWFAEDITDVHELVAPEIEVCEEYEEFIA